MSFLSTRDPAQRRLLLLTAILFVSYLGVGVSLPIVSIHVTRRLGLANAWAGLAVGIAFLATVATRGHAGSLSDRRGAKVAVARGLGFYVAGAATSALSGLPSLAPWPAFVTLVAGRLLLGLGESLVAVGVISWGIGLVGPARSGRVLALVGAALYGAIVGLQGIGFAAIGAFFALHFLHRHWSGAGLGLSAFGGGFVLVRVLFGHLPDRIGGLRVALVSLAVETLGQWLIWQAGAPALALAGAFLTGLGCSMIFPAMGREVVAVVAPHLRGTALGAFAAFQDVAYGATGPLAGLLADRVGVGSVFAVGAGAAALGLAIALGLRRAAALPAAPR